jgi:intein/homing endonuclease
MATFLDFVPQPLWSDEDQLPSQSNLLTNTALIGGGVTGLHLLGKAKLGNSLGYDRFVGAIRTAEEYSPGGFLRTFQLSNFFSQFTSEAKSPIFISPEFLSNNPEQLTYLSKLIGSKPEKIGSTGLSFSGNKLFWGSSQDIALEHASVVLNTTATDIFKTSSHYSAGYARALGVDDYGTNWEGAKLTEVFSRSGEEQLHPSFGVQVIGGHSKLQAAKRQVSGIASELVERYNRLLQMPSDLPVIGRGYKYLESLGKRLPFGKEFFKYGLGVKPGGALSTLGRLSLKWGAVAPLGYLLYSEADRLVRNNLLFDKTVFNEGITTGIASLWAQGNLSISSTAETMGLHRYREWQEEAAPGSTNLSALAGFPLAGWIVGSVSTYGERVYQTFKNQRAGMNLEAARAAAMETVGEFGGSWFGKLGKNLISRGGIFKNLTPKKLAIGLGAFIGAAIVSPFIPGALIPSDRPDKLRRIYSGEEEVPVGKGAFWEMGNSKWEGSNEAYYAPHWFPRMVWRARDKQIWGEGADNISEFTKTWKENFTYDIEKFHYWDRPYPMCFHPDTPVYTIEGFKNISHIQRGDQVLNRDNEWTTVIEKTSRKCTEGKLIEITIAADNRKLLVTPQHKILCLKNHLTYQKRGDRNREKIKAIKSGCLEWIPAKDIKRHDFVVVPARKITSLEKNPIIDLAILTGRAYIKDKIIYDRRATQNVVDAFYSNLSIKDASKTFLVKYSLLWDLRKRNGYKKFLDRYLEIDEDMAYLFGLFLAEGFTSKDQVGFAFNSNEIPTYIADIQKIVMKKFQANTSVSQKSENGVQLRVYSRILSEILDGLFEKKHAPQKGFSLDYLSWPVRLKQAFAKGLIRGDGSTKKKNEITFTSASSYLTNQLRLLLLSIGIPVSFTKAVPKKNWKKALINGREIPKNVHYYLSITGFGFENFSLFEEEVKCIKTTGDRKGLIYNDNFYIPVRQIKEIPYEGDVFDITVEKEQSFLTTCIVHNSSPAFSEVPLIGPLLGATIGQVIKPEMKMHTSEWMQNGQQLSNPLGYGQTFSEELGQIPEGEAISPYSLSQTINEQMYRMCFTEDTRIRMADSSYKEIRNIVEKEFVWGHSSFEKVTKVFKRKNIQKDVLKEISLTNTYQKLKVTENHKVFALKTKYCSAKDYNCSLHGSHDGDHCKRCIHPHYLNYKPEWLSVKNLDKGDFLVEIIPKIINEKKFLYLPDILDMNNFGIQGNTIYRRIKKSFLRKGCEYLNNKGTLVKRPNNNYECDYLDKNAGSLPIRLELTWDLGWLCGYTLAEGSPSNTQISYAAEISETETHYKKLFESMKTLFNYNGTTTWWRKEKDGIIGNGVETSICSTAISQLFRTLIGLPSHKIIHASLLSSNREFLLGLINGFIDGDFHIREKELECNQSSLTLQKQLTYIFNQLGILVSNTSGYSTIKKNGQVKKYKNYGLGLFRTNIQKLRQLGKSGFKLSRPIAVGETNTTRNFIKEDNNYYFIFKKITNIKDIYMESIDLYDLEVENTHIYYAEDCLVHNSEMVGLPGFLFSSLKEELTGSPDFFADQRQLEAAGEITSARKSFWEEGFGGALGLSEWYRRLYPSKRKSIQTYNPIRNQMPQWMPDTGDLSEDFRSGDPFAKIDLGEVRLPGLGYEQRYPELAGLDPEDYPLIHIWKILADVAPYSSKYKAAAAGIRMQRSSGNWTDYEEELFNRTIEQIKAKKEKKSFSEYEVLEPFETGNSLESKVLSEINKENASGKKDRGIIGSLFGGYWEWISHGAETSLEQLTPMAPFAKFVHARTAIEDYEKDMIYGTSNKFWNKPIQNFLSPFASSTAHAFGWNGIPDRIQEQREIDEQFDALKYAKFRTLATRAFEAGDLDLADEYVKSSKQTLTGINPYTMNFKDLMAAIPARERSYFDAFRMETSPEAREKILQMVPEQMRPIYIAQWQRRFSEAAKKTDNEDALIAGAEIESLATSAGFPVNDELRQEYYGSRVTGESYADWYRRTYLVPKQLKEKSMPGPDWVGFHPQADLDDLKLKYVQKQGLEFHDFNLWPDREMASRYKPWVNNQSVQEIGQQYSEGEIRDQMNSLMERDNLQGNFTMTQQLSLLGMNSSSVELEVDRFDDVRDGLRDAFNGR